ncbi:nuclear transport factor 2 family protein [Christiangramia fulva]|uniref:Nuclear transport factor 2 family protein n=1 Tax=Christiangramia fulva TaxID=2126553 RepID=A0A2R3Z521_9FLAO|nr:nuclear transport factor 2 family protein [Christiangramia fulva]AVR45377.1 nuclear transport factor 2 family protein [Christiangramia fulva]
MKKFYLLGLGIVLFVSCNQQEKRYTEQSPEIDTYKKVIAAYENKDWQELANYYADSAKIMNNVTEENGQSLAELIAENKADAVLFKDWDYVDDDSEYEMTVSDKGNTWVNFWGIWKGTLKANNKTYTIPAHISAQFVDGKIVKEFGYWDNSEIVPDIQALLEAEQNTTEEIAVKE